MTEKVGWTCFPVPGDAPMRDCVEVLADKLRLRADATASPPARRDGDQGCPAYGTRWGRAAGAHAELSIDLA